MEEPATAGLTPEEPQVPRLLLVGLRRSFAIYLVPDSRKQVRKQIRIFGTMTDELSALADWLATEDVTQVPMVSTGVIWKSLFNLW